eukprot:g22942.t1
MMVQAGNIFSISYKVIEHHCGAIDASIVVSGMRQMSLFILMLLAVFWVSWLVLLWDHGLGMPLSPEDRELGGASIWLLSLAVFAGGLGCLSDLTYWSLVMRHPPPCTKAVGVGPADI